MHEFYIRSTLCYFYIMPFLCNFVCVSSERITIDVLVKLEDTIIPYVFNSIFHFRIRVLLRNNYTNSVVRRSRLLVCTSQGSLDVWDIYYAHSYFTTTYVTYSNLSLSCCVTCNLVIPTLLSVSG